MMDNATLKKAIVEDINSLKHLDLDILPARAYYTELFRCCAKICGVLTIMNMVVSFVCLSVTWLFSKEYTLFVFAVNSIVGLVASIIIAFVFSVGFVNKYILFKKSLAKELMIGDYILHVCRRLAWIYFGVFTLAYCLTVPFVFPVNSFAMAAGLLASLIFGSMVVNFEIDRLGMSTLFLIIRQYFDDPLKESIELNK